MSILVTWLHALTVSLSAIIDGSHVRSKTTIKAFTNYLLSNNIAEFFFLICQYLAHLEKELSITIFTF